MRVYESNLVRSVVNGTYVVRSESGDSYYIVNSHGCTCPDSMTRHMLCKHTWACYVGAILTVWRIQMADTAAEAEQIAASFQGEAPPGIKQTIRLELDSVIASLSH
jgi:hypothetical protein